MRKISYDRRTLRTCKIRLRMHIQGWKGEGGEGGEGGRGGRGGEGGGDSR